MLMLRRGKIVEKIKALIGTLFYYLHHWPDEGDPEATPLDSAYAYATETNSKAPRGLMHTDGRTTVQFESLGRTFAKLSRLSGILAHARPTHVPEAWIMSSNDDAAMARVLIHEAIGQRYLLAVAGYTENATPTTMTVALGPHFRGLRNVLTGACVPLDGSGPVRTATLELAPGDGELFVGVTDSANLPTSYTDDFVDNRFLQDASSYRNVARYDVGFYGEGLSATAGNLTANDAYIIYDLDTLLGSSHALRAVIYDGFTTLPSDRGVFVSVSQDGVNFTPLGGNASGIGVPFTARYAKVGVSYYGAADYGYGYLKRIAFAGWPVAVNAP